MPSSGVPQPYRVAAIDVGSNAIRYLVAEVSGSGAYTVVESERLAVRLGTDVFTRERRFTEASLDAAALALTQIRRRIDDLGIVHCRAVATSAVRESRNGGELVERVRRESGIHLETISGNEESRLVWVAVRERLDLGDERWLAMDLGGGSVEISVICQEGILWTESHALGSVRLLQAVESDGRDRGAADLPELLARYAQVLKVRRAVSEWMPAGTIATGGNIEALAVLSGVNQDPPRASSLRTKDLRRVIDKLAGLTYHERIEQLELREDVQM